jgi:aldose 1-epimerase
VPAERSSAGTEVEGLDAVILHDPASDLAAAFVPGAGMVCTSLRHRGAELLGQRGGLSAYMRKRKTMGIPLLHPWANRLAGDEYRVGGRAVRLRADQPLVRRDEHGLPIHGLLSGSPFWRLIGLARDGTDSDWDLRAELDFAAHHELLDAFPFPHRLRLEVALRDATLTVRTTLVASGDAQVPVAFGFHPYLQLPGVERERWQVELPAMSRLELDRLGIPTGGSHPAPASAGPLGDEALDDGFVDVPPGARFALAGGERRIVVGFDEGFAACQVFAPTDDDVICFEPMAAPTNALVSGDRLPLVDPGASFVAAFSIAVEER